LSFISLFLKKDKKVCTLVILSMYFSSSKKIEIHFSFVFIQRIHSFHYISIQKRQDVRGKASTLNGSFKSNTWLIWHSCVCTASIMFKWKEWSCNYVQMILHFKWDIIWIGIPCLAPANETTPVSFLNLLLIIW